MDLESILKSVFDGGPFYAIGNALWDIAITLIGATASKSPANFSVAAWNYTINSVMSWSISLATILLNIMYMIGIIRQSTNLKENFTLEIMVDSLIKVLAGNFLMLNGKTLILKLFNMAANISGEFLLVRDVSFSQMDLDAGSYMFYLFYGILYLAVSMVCAGTIFMTVYGRYLQLYLLTAVGPFAWSTIPAGHGISSVASSWIRTFLAKCFEIVIIVLAISIASILCQSIDFGQLSGIGENFDGAIQAVQNMATMVILAGMVKGSDSFMRRTFGF